MRHEWKTFAVLLLVLIMCAGTALSDILYVKTDIDSSLSLRDENTNEVLCTIPAGTALEPNGGKSTDMFAYVTYGGYSGYVLWSYLTRTASEGAEFQTVQPTQTPESTGTATEEPAGGHYTLKTIGAIIQEAESNSKGKGPEKTEMAVTADDNVIVTAQIPGGSKLEYWVINGIRYDFLRTVKWMRITAFDRSWTIEAVCRKAEAETLRSEEEIQAARTGNTLIAKVNRGEMCHIKNGTKGGGGWMTSFDFTADYNNRATGVQEKGGQLSAKIRANIPKGKRVSGWKLDETKFYFPATINDFVVRTLDTPMIYEPIYGTEPAKPTDPPSEKKRKPRDPTYGTRQGDAK